MKKIAQTSCFIFIMLLITFSAQAQKFGYLNSQAILANMPEVKEMNSNLKVLGEQLQKKGKQMYEEYQKELSAAQQKEAQGELAPIDKEKISKKLEEKQNEILAYEKDMQKQLAEKEQSLIEPILEKINEAIEAVAKEKGLTMVFEQGVLLYADESMNINEDVKAKL